MDFDPLKTVKGKKMAKKPAAAKTPGVGHNNTGLTEAQEKVYIRAFSSLKAGESAMAKIKGEMNGDYKLLEGVGLTKDHIKWGKDLEKRNVSEVILDLKIKIGIARLMGHAAGRQLDFLDTDRTPLEDQAYLEGLAGGKLGKDPQNIYGMETVAGQNFQRGFNEGNALRNAALNEAINGAASANIIKTGGDESDDDGDQNTEDADAETADADTDGQQGEVDPDDQDWANADPNQVAANED